MKDFIEILKNLKDTSPFAWWEWDIAKGHFRFSSGRDVLFHFDLEKFLKLYILKKPKNSFEKIRKMINSNSNIYKNFVKLKDAEGEFKWYLDLGGVIEKKKDGNPKILRGVLIEIKKLFEIDFLEEKEIIIVCSNCGRIKILNSKWVDMPAGVQNLKNGRVSHSLCPRCLKKFYN